MGSWNETCAVSNLPILDGDEVYWLLLTQNPYTKFSKTECYCTDFFFPRCLPVLGKYVDCGEVEPSDGEGLFAQSIIDQLKTDMIEWRYSDYVPRYEGDDKSREEGLGIPETTFENLNFDNLQEWLHKGNVFIDKNALDLHHYGKNEEGKIVRIERKLAVKPLPLSPIMIRKDIWNSLCGSEIQSWRGEISRLYFENSLEKIRRLLKDKNIIFRDISIEMKLERFLPDIPFMNCASSVAAELLIQHANNENLLDKIMTRMVELGMINTCLSFTRKHWSPTTGSGSQNEDFENNINMYKKFILVAKKAIKDLEEYRKEIWGDE